MTEAPRLDPPPSSAIERPAIWPLFLLAGALIAVGFGVVLTQRAGGEEEPEVRGPEGISGVEEMVWSPGAEEGPRTATFSAAAVTSSWRTKMVMTQQLSRGQRQVRTALGWEVVWEQGGGGRHRFKLHKVELGVSTPGQPLRTSIPEQLESLLSEGSGEMSWDETGEVTEFRWTMTTNAQMKPALKLIEDALRLGRPRFVNQRVNQQESWSTQIGWAGESAPQGASIRGGLRLKNTWVGMAQMQGHRCAKVLQEVKGAGELIWPTEAPQGQGPGVIRLEVKEDSSQGVLCHSLERNVTLGHDFKVVTSWYGGQTLWQESEVTLRTRWMTP